MTATKILLFLRRAAAWLFWPAVLLITWGELTPQPPELGPVFGWDKAEHFTAYFGLAIMATLVLGRGGRLAVAILALIAFSGGLEILQAYTGRDPEWLDFLANSVGALSGLALGLALLKITGALVDPRRED